MTWWYWMFLGLALLGGELLTPGGFYILFFGLAALMIGTLGGLGIVTTDWLQWLLFSLLSVVSLLFFRGRVLEWAKRGEPAVEEVDSLVGEVAVLLEDIAPHALGKAELRGSTWSARNSGAAALAKGQRARVDRVQGLTLWLIPE